MPNPSRHAEHVAQLLAGAIVNYNEDGYLAPTLILCGPRDFLIVRMAASEDLSPRFAEAAGALATTRRDTEVVVTIVEAWMKDYSHVTDPEPPALMHGELERAHYGGDLTVHTALVVQAIDTSNAEHDCVVTYHADGPTTGDTDWMVGSEITVASRLPDMMRRALRLARTMTMPPAMDTNAVLQVLMDQGRVEFAIEPMLWSAS